MPYLSSITIRRAAWRARARTAAALAPAGHSLVRQDRVEAAERAAQGVQRQHEQRIQDLFERSERERAAGDAQAASEHLRVLLLADAGNAKGWHLYALRLLEAGAYDAAFEALKNALAVNAGNLDALELLVDAGSRQPHRRAAVDRALAELTAVLQERPELHRRWLDFAIPLKRVDTLGVLEHSPDRVTRAIVALWRADMARELGDFPGDQREVRKPEWLTEDEFLVAQLLYALQRGRRTRALALLRMVPDRAVSRWSLRQAIRRALRANQFKGALRLLREYRRLEPEDGWAAAQEVKLQRSVSPTNYQLARQGFPFPPRQASPLYIPVTDRVFYLLHNSLPYHSAGYSTRTHGLLTGLRGRGWDVRGITRLGYPYDMPNMADLGGIGAVDVVDGVPYHRLSTTPGIEKKSPITEYVDRYVGELTRVARKQRPAVIHGASNHWNGLAAVSAANRLGIPSVYEVRGLWEVTRGSRDPEWAKGGMYRFMARMEADAAAHATHVLAITNALKDELVARGVDAEKITVVPNAVDADRFTPAARDTQLEEALGVRGKTVIGYIGSVLDYEGLELLIDAADVMHARREDFTVLIVGDGAELEKFQDLVRERELEDFVRFTGRVPHEQVERYYSLVDIAPFPRLPLPVCEMVSPLKPFEALAMGKAVVASDVAALAEIIEPGVNGLLHRKGDTEDLVRHLEVLLEDPSLRAKLARQGREWVRENRQWSDMAEIVSSIYRELGAEASQVREAAN